MVPRTDSGIGSSGPAPSAASAASISRDTARIRAQTEDDEPKWMDGAALFAAPIHDHQAGIVPGVGRSGGDPVRRQVEIEINGLQACCSLQSTLQNFGSR